MGKGHKWVCEKIIKKFHAVSDIELEQRLAELWEVLVENKSQFQNSQHQVLVPVKSLSPFLQNKRRTK
jgi:hypothetical protein